VPHAQAPAARPPKKNPLLKLAEPWPDEAVLLARRSEAERRPLFQSTEPLAFTLAADFRLINKDRDPESATRYPALLTLTDQRGREQTIHVRISPRGHFRRKARTCAFVPLRIELPAAEIAGTVFEGQSTLKLGPGARTSHAADHCAVLTYPIFNVVTPAPRARLAAHHVDAKSAGADDALRDLRRHDNDVARRLGGARRAPAHRVQGHGPPTLTLMMLFEYMISSTDFSL
jgi:hypothetical protein